MAFTIGKASLRRALVGGVGVITALMLNACGGGGGSSGTNASGGGTGTTTTPTISLSLIAPATSSSSLAAYGSTTLQVKVLSNGVADTNSVSVTFTSPCATSGKATLTPSALTTAGIAQATYTDKGCSATDTITIATAGATSITATLVVAQPTPASIQFVSASPSTDSIVIHGAGGNGRVETATLTYKVLDTFGNPLPNEPVTFAVFPSGLVTLGATSGITDSTGQVTVSVSSGSQPTTFRVNATLPSGQTTISDTITVTTGQTSAASFSLSVDNYNIEGWNYDGVTATITILLADAFGNPVADGTPVVFETDSGAVGSSSNGGCTTTDGACSVSFRSQNPRYGAGHSAVPAGKRAGLATITVSTTTASTTISGQTGIFLAGSFASAATAVVTSSGNTVTGTGPYTVTVPNCNSTSFNIQLNDVNSNPLPVTTTIAAAATTNNAVPTAVIGKIFPSSVLDIGPGSLTDTTSILGSVHNVQFTPGGGTGTTTVCTPGSASTLEGEIDITVTTPKGNVTIIPVYIVYPH